MGDDFFPSSQQAAAEIEMESRPNCARSTSRQSLLSESSPAPRAKVGGLARHTLGVILLLCVVFLWTICNFLGSVRSPSLLLPEPRLQQLGHDD
jgi:hypothetical protein